MSNFIIICLVSAMASIVYECCKLIFDNALYGGYIRKSDVLEVIDQLRDSDREIIKMDGVSTKDKDVANKELRTLRLLKDYVNTL